MRPLPPPTLANLNPPARGYHYFNHADCRLDIAAGIGSARNRWLLAECALLAYDDEAAIREAFEGRSQKLELLHAPVAGGSAYAVDLSGGSALLAFRGTQVFNPGDPLPKFRAIARDYLTNAQLARHEFEDGSRVHGGFHASAQALLADLRDKGWLQSSRRWLICGHSLGGALAVLASESIEALPGHSVAAVLTLGQPRVGNARHVARLERLPFPILRLVHGCDVIPSVPPESLDYAHVPTEQVLAPERRASYPATVLQNVFGLWRQRIFGLGALSPAALQDHAPLTYVTHCYNQFDPGTP